MGDGPHQGIGRGLGLGRVVDRLRRRRSARSCSGLVLPRPARPSPVPLVRAEPADVGQDLVQAVTGDVLHGVVADAVVLAVVEDRDDIGVVQLGRRAGFVMEPPEVVGAGAEPWVHDLERDAAAGAIPARPRRPRPCPLRRCSRGCGSRPAAGATARLSPAGCRRPGADRGPRSRPACAGRGSAAPALLGGRATHASPVARSRPARGAARGSRRPARGSADVLGQRRPLPFAETRQE